PLRADPLEVVAHAHVQDRLVLGGVRGPAQEVQLPQHVEEHRAGHVLPEALLQAQSLGEYVAGSMLLDVLRELSLLGRPSDPAKDETILDMSVGYDLEGIRSER